MSKFTKMELKVLVKLYKSASGNGHDFGFIEDARGTVNVRQLGAIVTSLVKKRIIEVHEPITTDSGTWTQFTWITNSADVALMVLPYGVKLTDD